MFVIKKNKLVKKMMNDEQYQCKVQIDKHKPHLYIIIFYQYSVAVACVHQPKKLINPKKKHFNFINNKKT
jgi:hypothetical protein